MLVNHRPYNNTAKPNNQIPPMSKYMVTVVRKKNPFNRKKLLAEQEGRGRHDQQLKKKDCLEGLPEESCSRKALLWIANLHLKR